MSRCPFGGEMLEGLLQTREQLGDRLQLKVHYIGRTEGETFTTMYGPRDVDGDKVQLCARQVADDNAWLKFLSCQSRQPEVIPDNWPDCAKEAGVDAAKLSECTSRPVANELLKSSFALSQARHIKASPTLLIDGAKYEGGRLSYHLDRAICAAMAKPKHAYCGDMREPPELEIRLLTETECEKAECGTGRFERFVELNLPGASVRKVSVVSDEGKALLAAAGGPALPAAIVGPALRQRPTFAKMKPHLNELGDDLGYLFEIGPAQGK